MTFSVKEIFLTLQGEGAHTGKRAVFVRFTGCNIWSGREKDRERHASKGMCATWCDTDFVGTDGENGGRYSADELVEKIVNLSLSIPCLVVFTGGEPMLQVRPDLCRKLVDLDYFVCIETNGSKDLTRLQSLQGVWLTVSPKPPMKLHPSVYQGVDEVKVVHGTTAIEGRDYLEYEDIPAKFYFLQPLDSDIMGVDTEHQDITTEILAGNSKRPWRLSLQIHKEIGLP